MILSFPLLHILSYAKLQQTLLVPSPVLLDMKHGPAMGTSGEQFLTSSLCYTENQKDLKDKIP